MNEENLEINEESAETIQAENISMNQSSANSIFADELKMLQSAAVGVKAHTITMNGSGTFSIQADEVELSQSGVAFLKTENAQLQGNAGLVLANNVELQEGAVFAVASQNLRAKQIQTKILLAGNVEGEVHTVVDTREAILIGLIGGIVSGIFLLMGKFLFGRKN